MSRVHCGVVAFNGVTVMFPEKHPRRLLGSGRTLFETLEIESLGKNTRKNIYAILWVLYSDCNFLRGFLWETQVGSPRDGASY